MTPEIEKLQQKILQCTQESSDRVYFAAYDRIFQIGKLGKRKQHRAAALEALQQLALKAFRPLRSSAANQLADLLSPQDDELLPFLRKGLSSKEIHYGSVCGLLKVLGADAYPDIVPLILDPQRTLDARVSALDALCEHSGQPFDEDLPLYDEDLKAADIPVGPLRAWAKAGFPAYVPEKIDVPVAALGKLGIKLPADYIEFLRQHRRSATYENDDGCWNLTTAAKLLAKINVSGRTVPSIQQLKRYADVLQKAIGADATEDQRGKPYGLDRLAAGIAIGGDDCGDVLYLDPADKHSVWMFHHDGGDVEQAAKTFKAWLRQAERASD